MIKESYIKRQKDLRSIDVDYYNIDGSIFYSTLNIFSLYSMIDYIPIPRVSYKKDKEDSTVKYHSKNYYDLEEIYKFTLELAKEGFLILKIVNNGIYYIEVKEYFEKRIISQIGKENVEKHKNEIYSHYNINESQLKSNIKKSKKVNIILPKNKIQIYKKKQIKIKR